LRNQGSERPDGEVDEISRGTVFRKGREVTLNEVTVIVPTLNEEQAIGHVIEELRSVGFERILIVDGHSQDKTVEVARSLNVEVILQHGRGKAGALVSAFGAVSTPFCLIIDGDGTYDPIDAAKLVPLLASYDYVKGERRAKVTMDQTHRFGNFVITRAFNLLFGTSFQDVCSGMYASRLAKISKINFIGSDRTSAEQEILAYLVNMGAKIASVPVSYRPRVGGASKVNTWRQGVRDLYRDFVLAKAYNPVLLFSLIAALALVPAVGLLTFASYLYLAYNAYHAGYFLASLMFFVLGGQGLTVATIGYMLRGTERRLTSLTDELGEPH
jgi:dolichol-phosphate hexosyltransferase